MVDILNKRKNFSTKGSFVLYDWKDSGKDEYYLSDEKVIISFFIKDLHPAKILEDIFVSPMKKFKFRSGLEPEKRYSGNVANSNLKYLFASFKFPRTAEFNWTKENIPIKRDTHLSSLEKETEIMKYLSKYIDN